MYLLIVSGNSFSLFFRHFIDSDRRFQFHIDLAYVPTPARAFRGTCHANVQGAGSEFTQRPEQVVSSRSLSQLLELCWQSWPRPISD